jgi:hypothetical protein
VITLAEAKEALSITDSAQDAAVQRLIDRATDTLGRELLLYLGPEAPQSEVKDTEYPALYITLDAVPTATPALVMSTRSDIFSAWEITDPAEYALEGQRVYHRTGWPIGLGVVKAEYEAGYAAGAGPQRLQDLVLQAITERWNSNLAGAQVGSGIKSETIGDYSYTNFTAAELAAAAAALGSSWEDYIKRWRRRLI